MNELLAQIHRELGVNQEHIQSNRLTFSPEAKLSELEVVEIDFEGKPFLLERRAAAAWKEMRTAAASDNILLQPYSGFRSYRYQQKLIERQATRGRPLSEIFTNTAIPGYSEHHSGRAVDICTDNKFILEEAFEKTNAFRWLQEHGSRFQFRLSYPRDNGWGIIFEPWHWYYFG